MNGRKAKMLRRMAKRAGNPESEGLQRGLTHRVTRTIDGETKTFGRVQVVNDPASSRAIYQSLKDIV